METHMATSTKKEPSKIATAFGVLGFVVGIPFLWLMWSNSPPRPVYNFACEEAKLDLHKAERDIANLTVTERIALSGQAGPLGLSNNARAQILAPCR
jgi:hypothetical protein